MFGQMISIRHFSSCNGVSLLIPNDVVEVNTLRWMPVPVSIWFYIIVIQSRIFICRLTDSDYVVDVHRIFREW